MNVKDKVAVAFPVAADVGREEDVADLVSSTVARLRRIDLFVSNAGATAISV